jgi:hypothetical protein
MTASFSDGSSDKEQRIQNPLHIVAGDELPEFPNPTGMDLRKDVKRLPCLGERGLEVKNH